MTMLSTLAPGPRVAGGSLAEPAPSGECPVEARAARGDREALGALLRQHAPALVDLCRILIGPGDAGDAAQAALERVVTTVRSFDPRRGSFRSWALTVTRNVCRDRLRRRGLERATFLADGEDVTQATAGSGPDPERLALARADSRQVARALETLPVPMRTALVLYHVHEATYEEIAAALEVPLGTVMTWLHRGRKRLRAALDEGATTVAPAQEGGAR